MYSEISYSGLLLLWLCLVLLIAQLILVLKAQAIEIEHGLRRNSRRVSLAAGLTVAVGILVLTTSCLALIQPTPPMRQAVKPEPSATVSVTQDESKLAELKKKKEDLDKQLEELKARQKEIAKEQAEVKHDLTQSGGTAEPDVVESGEIDHSAWNIAGIAILFVPILVFGSAALILFLGDPDTLMMVLKPGELRSQRRLKSLAILDRMTTAVERERYADALNISDELDDKSLDRLDQLDWIYLKAFATVQVASGAYPKEAEQLTGFQNRNALELAVRDLEGLLDNAPNRAEAKYLLALAHAFLGKYQPSLDLLNQCESDLRGVDVGLNHNRSVCLLHLAEESLSRGEIEVADKNFTEVIRLGVLSDEVPTTWVRVRFQNVRRELQAGNVENAIKELATVRSVEKLSDDQRQKVELTCCAYETVIPLKQNDDAKAEQQIEAFLRQYVPQPMWEVGEEIIDEHLESAADDHEWPLSREVYRAMFFSLSVARTRILVRSRKVPTDADLKHLVQPLFCSLQFHLRHRDLIAAIGGAYYWLRPQDRKTALVWLRAAVDMGVQSRSVLRIMERDKRLENERNQTMDWFRSRSARFLTDPTLRQQVRQAFIEQLSQFQEFKPMLLEFEESLDETPEEPTLKRLHERAIYLDRLAAELAVKKRATEIVELNKLRSEYGRLVQSLDQDVSRLSDLEKKLFTEVGKTVFSHS